jgi:Uma2 family endonuclease
VQLEADVVDAVRPITSREYARFVATGVFDDDAVELLQGVIVRMSPPHGPEHDGTIHKLAKRLGAALGDRAEVRVQSAFDGGERSQPEPDIAVVPPGEYLDAHPTVAWLIVEVADSPLARDRTVKAALYAEALVEEYWVVDLVHRVVEVRTEPGPSGYTQLATRRVDDVITPRHFPEVRVAVLDILRAAPG